MKWKRKQKEQVATSEQYERYKKVTNTFDRAFNRLITIVILIAVGYVFVVQVIPMFSIWWMVSNKIEATQKAIEEIEIPSETVEAKVIQTISKNELLVNVGGQYRTLKVADIAGYSPQCSTRILPGQKIWYSEIKNSNSVRLWKTDKPKSAQDLY